MRNEPGIFSEPENEYLGMKPSRPFSQSHAVPPTGATEPLCSWENGGGVRCPWLVWVEVLASPCSLQADLILASCWTSFNTYVWAGEVSHLPTHLGMPPCLTPPEGREAGEGCWTPTTCDPSMSLQHLSCVARVPPERALFLEVLPEKCMRVIFPSRSSLSQPQMVRSDPNWACTCPQHAHPSGGPCREHVTPLILLQRGPWVIPSKGHSKALCHCLNCCAISNLENRGSENQTLSSEDREFHRFLRPGVPPTNWQGEPALSPRQGWGHESRFWLSKPWPTDSSKHLGRIPSSYFESMFPGLQEPVSVSADSAPGARTSDHKAMLCHCSS